jgi:type IV pilus assembly protein PilM
MILKKLFLPEEINNYYLFSKRILGVDIGKTHVNITQISLAGKTISIEKNISELIEPGQAGSNGERAALALKKAIAQCDKYDEIRTALSSAQIVFKELSLPFTTRGKIEKIVAFEVEPLLPFTLADAALDFIITQVNQEQQSAHVLVAATQKQYIAQHLQIFELAEIKPNIITVDLLGVYSLYQSIPKFAAREGIVALVDLGFNSTRIACLYKNQLRTIRTINKGIASLAKAIADSMGITPAQALENIIRFGLRETDSPQYHKAIHDALSALWNDVSFTFSSFAHQMKQPGGIEVALLLGGGAQMRGLPEFVSGTIGIPCELFDGSQLADLPHVTLKNKIDLTTNAMISLSAALPTPTMQDFNLLSADLSQTEQSLVNKQIVVAALLSCILLISLIIYTFAATSRLSWAVHAAETEAVAAIKEQFPDVSSGKLDDAKDEAAEEVEKEEKTWGAFSNRVRSSDLQYLFELTNKIDKQSIGLNLEEIKFSENTLILKGHVDSYDAFRNLRKALRESDLFGPPIDPKEELDFTMTIPLMNAEEA